MLFKRRPFVYLILSGLLLAVFPLWSFVFAATTDHLKIVFFDVGQGDSIFIETPSKKQVLIDGGPDKMVLEKLGQVMSFYDRTIDLVILTHPDSDHLTGLVEVLKHFKIGRIIVSGFKGDSGAYEEWLKEIQTKEIETTLAQAGQKIIFPDGAVIEILWPDQSRLETISKANDASVVGRLVYGQTEIILTGDIEKKVENILLGGKLDLAADILKVAHHGSKTSASSGFLGAVGPAAAIISVGQDNRFGHPNQEVLDRLKNAALYRTDENGDIQILTDGQKFGTLIEK